MKKLSDDHKELLEFYRYLWQDCPDVPYGPKGLYTCLLTYENLKKNTCWVCQETLSHHLCCAIKSLKSWTTFLEEKDMIRCERRREGRKLRIKYTLFHPQHRKKLPDVSSNSPESVVPFPSQICTNSTHLMTQKDGNIASM